MNFRSPGYIPWLAEFTPNTPHFFKIILDVADTQKLRIPEKFANRYVSGISNLVTLRVPTGELWNVELTKCEDDTWLHNGWSEFAKQYSLSNGSFLVFRFEGNCNFHVIIFDRSDTEISYPYRGIHGSWVPNGGGYQYYALEDNNDGISVEVMDDTPPSKNTRVGSPSPSGQPHKEIEPTSNMGFQDHALEDNNDDISVEVMDDTPPSEEMRVRSPSPSSQPHREIESTSNINSRHSPVLSSEVLDEIREPELNGKRSGKCPHQATVSRKERAKAFLEASSFKSENPFFLVVMQPSYVNSKLSLPVKFCSKYLPKHSCDALLCVSHRKARSVGFLISCRPKLKCGWKAFVKENNLKVGDVCVFELLNQTKVIFNVVIFRRSKDAETVSTPAKDGAEKVPCKACLAKSAKRLQQATLSSEERSKAFLEASSFRSENPFFVVVMQPSYVCGRICLPANFCGQYLPKHSCDANLCVSNGESRSVVLSMSTVPKFKAGWRAFVKENNLKLGDVCVFELINQTKVTFNVVIFHRTQDEMTIPTPARDGAEEELCTIGSTSQIFCVPAVPPCSKSATQTSYPHGGIHGDRVPNGGGPQDQAVEDNDDDTSVEVLDDTPPSKKARVRSPSPSSRPPNTLNSTSSIGNRHSPIISSGVRYETPEPDQFNVLVDSAKRSGSRPHQGTLSRQERAKAFLEANSFKSENPFFVSVMQPSYINGKSLSVPVSFCGKYLPKKYRCDAILSVSRRNSRSVVLIMSTVPKLRCGWKAFVKENHLEVGDVCVFELIDQTQITFNVVIYRRFQDARTGPTPATEGSQEEPCTISSTAQECCISDVPPSNLIPTPTKNATSAAQRYTAVNPENPFFKITTPPSGIHFVNAPCSFIKEHIKQDSVNLTLEHGGKMWPVKVSTYPMNKIAFLGLGWDTFVRENYIKPGEVCVLELINREDAVLRVHTSRNMEKDIAQEEPCTVSTTQNCSVPEVPPCEQTPTPAETVAIAPQRFTASEIPSCPDTDPPSAFTTCVLYSFFEELIKQDAVSSTLENPGRLWLVKISIYPEHKIVNLRDGWDTSVREFYNR